MRKVEGNNGRVPTRDAVVTRDQRAFLQAKEKLGMLWPLDIWLAHFDKTEVPASKKKMTLERGHRTAHGVLEPPSVGWAPGCIELDDVWQDGAQMKAEEEKLSMGGAAAVKAAFTSLSQAHGRSARAGIDRKRQWRARGRNIMPGASAEATAKARVDRRL